MLIELVNSKSFAINVLFILSILASLSFKVTFSILEELIFHSIFNLLSSILVSSSG